MGINAMSSRSVSPNPQSRQALTEMAVLAVILIPLILLIPLLGKYIHARMPGVFGRAAELLPRWLPGDFPPSDSNGNVNGLVTARLDLSFQNLRVGDDSALLFLAPFDAIDLQLQVSHTVLGDAWNARDRWPRRESRRPAGAGLPACHHRSPLVLACEGAYTARRTASSAWMAVVS